MSIKNIVFDFDGTIAKSTPYHRIGWDVVLKELGLGCDLNTVLPYEPNLRERFDSYRRIKSGFLRDKVYCSKVRSYFNCKDEEKLVRKVMNLKESFAINSILKENLQATLDNLGINLAMFLYNLKDKIVSIGVISSTRETIINSFLYKCGISNLFDFVIGEESLTDSDGNLFDKPSSYAKQILNNRRLGMDLYIGDNEEIDKEFSEACGASFMFADYKTNFLDLLGKINI